MHLIKRTFPYLTPIILFIIVLFPHFRVFEAAPKVSLIDFLLPFLTLIIFFNYKEILSMLNKNLKIYFLITRKYYQC